MRALRIFRGGAEFGMVVEVPTRELRRRDTGRQRVEETEEAIGARPVAVEDRLVDDLVKEHGPVEHDEAEDERARDARPQALEMPAERERGGEEEKLAKGDREVPRGALLVEHLQDVMRHGGREAFSEVSDGMVVVAGLHPRREYAGRREKAPSCPPSSGNQTFAVSSPGPSPPTSSATT
jgi:hypothetical protein